MCGLCGTFGVSEHWTDGGTSRASVAERRHRARVANIVLGLYGLRLREWQGRFVLSSRTGKTTVVDNVGAVWPAAERLSGSACDALDPEVIARIEAFTP